jgi:hypothetical protein
VRPPWSLTHTTTCGGCPTTPIHLSQILAVAAEPIEARQEALIEYIERFVDKVVDVAPNHRDDTVVTAVEANLSFIDANQIARVVGLRFEQRRHRGRVVHMFHNERIVGVMTTHEVKEQMARNTERMLRDGLIYFDSRFSSVSPGKTAAVVMEELISELDRYRRVNKVSIDKSTMVRKITFQLTGKVDNGNDDMAIVFQMLAYWHIVYFRDPKYTEMR